MSKFTVVRGFQHPRDAAKKSARFAVVLGMVNGRVIVAPATSYPARTGTVPRGSVLLTDKSPAYAASGFNVEQVAISIRDAGLYSIDSQYLKDVSQVGVLNLAKDKRFADQVKMLMKEYDLLHCPKYVG